MCHRTSISTILLRERASFCWVLGRLANRPCLRRSFPTAAISMCSGTNDERGTGFGLPLAKQFVEAFAGDIGVISTEQTDDPAGEHGTTFTLRVKSA